MSTDGQTHTHTDAQTQMSHAICYSYGADKNGQKSDSSNQGKAWKRPVFVLAGLIIWSYTSPKSEASRPWRHLANIHKTQFINIIFRIYFIDSDTDTETHLIQRTNRLFVVCELTSSQKFYKNVSRTFWVILLTDRQTDKPGCKHKLAPRRKTHMCIVLTAIFQVSVR